MDVSQQGSLRYRFHGCILDTHRRELQVAGTVVPLQPRAFNLLTKLVSCAGEALTKDQLIAEIWPTSHVTDAVLTTAVARIRRAIGDTGATPMLATLHGIGYRFDAAVVIETTESQPAAREEAPMPPKPSLPAAAATPVESHALGTAAPPQASSSISNDTEFWSGQWQRGLELLQQWKFAGALQLLELAGARRVMNAEDFLALGKGRKHRMQLDAATQALDQGLQSNPDANTAARIMLEKSQISMLHHDVANAMELTESVAESIALGDVDASLLPQVLALQCRALHLNDEQRKIGALVEQLEIQAKLPDDACALAFGLVMRARAMYLQGLEEAAVREAERALELSSAHACTAAQMEAYCFLSYIMDRQWQVSRGLELALRARAVVLDVGDSYYLHRALVCTTYCQIRLGDLESAMQAYEDLLATAPYTRSALVHHNIELAAVNISWMKGDTDEALRRLRDLIAYREWPGSPQHGLRLLEAKLALSCSDASVAARLVVEQEALLATAPKNDLLAGIELLNGDRARAKSLLRRAWAANRHHGPGKAWLLAMSLACLQLEDGDAHGLAELMSDFRAAAEVHPALEFLLHVHDHGTAIRAPELERTIAKARRLPGLRNRHGWILQPAGMRAWLSGERQLTELYSNAWF